MQELVRDFHVAVGATVGETIELRNAQLRARLIEEEAREAVVACMSGKLPQAVHEICDVLYVCFGAAVAWGVDLEEAFKLVHAANMTKVQDVKKRPDGKVTKGKNYRAPDIAGYLKGKGYGVEPVAPAPLEKTKTKKAVDADRPLRD